MKKIKKGYKKQLVIITEDYLKKKKEEFPRNWYQNLKKANKK